MPTFLYHYQQLFRTVGAGTPANPGGDFSMYCWIEAPDAAAALEWGYALLGNYYRLRFAHASCHKRFDGLPIRDGELETNAETQMRLARDYDLPHCQVGHIPTWRAPWRQSNLTPKPDLECDRQAMLNYLVSRKCPYCRAPWSRLQLSDVRPSLRARKWRCLPPVPTSWQFACPDCNRAILAHVRRNNAWIEKR